MTQTRRKRMNERLASWTPEDERLAAIYPKPAQKPREYGKTEKTSYTGKEITDLLIDGTTVYKILGQGLLCTPFLIQFFAIEKVIRMVYYGQ